MSALRSFVDFAGHVYYDERMKRISTFVGFGLCFAFAASAANAPATFKVSEFTFKRPDKWEWVESASPMRKAQLKVGDAKNAAEVVFFHFGPSNGGGVQANVERWFGQ